MERTKQSPEERVQREAIRTDKKAQRIEAIELLKAVRSAVHAFNKTGAWAEGEEFEECDEDAKTFIDGLIQAAEPVLFRLLPETSEDDITNAFEHSGDPEENPPEDTFS